MLERTAGCLETGSLRRLLPASKKSLKSCRTLHSGFWNHAAGDTEFSPLWTALIRAAEPPDEQTETQVQLKSSTGNGGMFLDFLYPSGTLNFLRQYSGWGVDRQDGRWSRTGLGRLSHRQYTSLAKDSSVDSNDGTGSPGEKHGASSNSENVDLLRQLMSITRAFDYEEVWRQFLLLEGQDQTQVRKQVIQYFSTSGRVVDAERTTELFEMLEHEQKDSTAYRNTIRSYLKLRNLADAMQLQKTALKDLEIPAGSDELLAYLVNNSSWLRAFSIWEEFQKFRRRFPDTNYNIYKVLDSIPNVGPRASELVEYVNKRAESSSEEISGTPSRLLEFAAGIIKRVLLNMNSFKTSIFTSLLEALRQWGFDNPKLYQDAFQMLVQANQTKLAVNCYRKARQSEGVKFTRPMLHAVLKIFCDHHSVLGMHQVLDDFFRYYSKPSRIAYKMCMSEFADQGDAQTVHALFEQYTGRFIFKSGKPMLSADDMAPLLHVHAKRGEVAEVVRLFSQIQDNYGLDPTLLCWNILINAYGKVHDTDRAYECFEHLLYSERLRPDHYTFGTIMAICVTRGDVQRVLELYKLSEDLEIEKTAPMIDCVVLGHIQHEQLEQAEKICENTLGVEVKGSRTRMWNYLLIAYAMRRDLKSVNRLLRRMSEAKVDYDQYTYSALMQSLSIVKQPDRAYSILKNVMPEAGVKATNFHYAVVMGGYLANREIEKVFRVHNRMLRRGVRKSASTNLLVLKATAAEDRRLLEYGTDEEKLQRAMQMFQDMTWSIDPQDISDTARKGVGCLPLDITYSTMFYSYIMFVLGQSNNNVTVGKLYEEFKQSLPETRRESPPIEALSALMIAKFQQKDYVGVKECWDLALAQAKKQGLPLPFQNIPSKEKAAALGLVNLGTSIDASLKQGHDPIRKSPQPLHGIVTFHQLDLTTALTTYMRSLDVQVKMDELNKTIADLIADGFVLDNENWNHYIIILCHRYKFKQAFELCEQKLMDGWTGWARIRWQLPERNRLPVEIRNLKKQPKHMRPRLHTLLALARAFLEMQSSSAESRGSQILLKELELSCPRTLHAINTMQRVDDDIERQALQGY